MTYLTNIAVTLACIIATGCGSAQLTRLDVHAGTIQIEGAYMEAVAEARTLAVEHCQGRVDLIEPGNVRPDQITFVCLDAAEPAAPVALATR